MRVAASPAVIFSGRAMKKLVMFGAGNIGRSFIAHLFSRAGYETVFVDIDTGIIEALNTARAYTVEIRDTNPDLIHVENVRGIVSEDAESVALEIADAEILATAVGPNNLPGVYPLIAKGLMLRSKTTPGHTIDIIICENLRNAAEIFREELRIRLPRDFRESEFPGLVETSIGKMVPLITHEEKNRDILTVYAEAYNTLILDRKGFRGDIPEVPGLDPKENMKAYVDRKLFIHNLGHSMTAYMGTILNPGYRYIWEAVGNTEVFEIVLGGMREARDALIAHYPDEFNRQNLDEHIEDLLARFANKALGDTIYRVGRDLKRKLSPNERLIGALRLSARYSLPLSRILAGIAAALHFAAKDEDGSMLTQDAEFIQLVSAQGISSVLRAVSGLSEESDIGLIDTIVHYYQILDERQANIFQDKAVSLSARLDTI